MSTQYDRQLSLTVSEPQGRVPLKQIDTGTTIEFGMLTPGSSAVKDGTRPTAGFSIRFVVRRGDTETPNTCDVRIYNLSNETMQQVSTQEFRTLKLQAGYPGNFGLIFQGNIKQVRIGRENAVDSYLDITAADGDSAYNYSVMAVSLAAGAKPADKVQQFIASMASGAIAMGYQPQLSESASIRGRVFWGNTKDEIRDYAEAYDLTWSIQDGRLTFIPKTAFIPGDPVIISPQTGLLGVPEQTQNGIECEILLNSQIKIGQLVQLQNTTINQLRYGLDRASQSVNPQLQQTVNLNAEGKYYVMAADHSGDTRGNDWITHLTLLAVNAQYPTAAAIAQHTIFPQSAIQRN